jgi:hypothetical protein
MPKKVHIDMAREFELGINLQMVRKIVDQVERQPEIITEARKMMFDKDPRKSMRASWLLVHASSKYPELVRKQLPYALKLLQQPGRDTGTIRECLQLFQLLGVPDKYCGQLFDISINFTKNGLMPHAVRAFSINLLAIICQKYPDLSPEVLLVLNELESFPQAPSITHCVKKAKKVLSKL